MDETKKTLSGTSGAGGRLYLAAGALCLLLFFCQGLYFIVHKSITFDEVSHFAAGISAWHTGDFRVYSKNPPLIRMIETAPAAAMVAGLPKGDAFERAKAIELANRMAAEYSGRFHRLVEAARLPALLLAVALGALIWWEAHRRYGKAGGLVAVLLYSSQPVLIGHGSLIMVDVGGALFFFLVVVMAEKYSTAGWDAKRAALLGALTGCAVASKFSNLALPFVIPVVIFIMLFKHGKDDAAGSSNPGAYKRAILYIALAGAAAWLVINIAYGFDGSFSRLDSFQFYSTLCKTMSGLLPGWLPVPLPFHFISGFDLQSFDNQSMGGTNALAFWMGKWQSGREPLFYPFLLCVKFTLPLLILCLAGIVLRLYLGIKKRAWSRVWLSEVIAVVLFYLLVAEVVAMYFSIRYLFPIVPFMILFAVDAASTIFKKIPSRWVKSSVFAVLIVSGIGTAVFAFPDYLAYDNILLGGEQRQNELDPGTDRHWGQDLIGLSKWIGKNHVSGPVYLGYFGAIDPKYYGIDWRVPPPRPVPGIWVVSRNWLIGDCPHDFMYIRDDAVRLVREPKPYFGWLKQKEPIAKIGQSLYVYRID